MNNGNTNHQMMDCKEAITHLNRYQDGELNPELCFQLESHLETCISCRSQYQMLQRLTEELKTIPAVTTPPNFTAQVMSRLYHEKKQPVFSFASLVYSFVFIVFCLLGFLLNQSLTNDTYVQPQVQEPQVQEPQVQVQPNETANLNEMSEWNEYAMVLEESRNLNLINLQDQALQLVSNSQGAQYE